MELEKVLEEIAQTGGKLKNDEEKTAFLLELDKNYGLEFCGRDDKAIYFKDPSTCGGCVQGQRVMRSLFESYSDLPYVKYQGDRQYAVDLQLAKIFVEEGKIGIEIEKEKRSLEEAIKELEKQESETNERKAKLIERFGKGITKIPGFLEKLLSETQSRSSGSCSIVDVKANPEKGVAAYILDEHWWSRGSGIGMASVVKVYRDGKEDSVSATYRDQYSPSKDAWSKDYQEIKIQKITHAKVSVKAIPPKEYSPKEFTFNLAKGKIKEKAQEKQEIALDEKVKFLAEVKKEMYDVLKAHQHNHPLYQPTRIVEYKIDYGAKQAAFILFEQIDTDRCTQQGEGWLGDQFRYSVWHVKGDQKPRQLYEDHAYFRKTVNAMTDSKGRDSVISCLQIEKGKIKAKDEEGKDLEIKIKGK